MSNETDPVVGEQTQTDIESQAPLGAVHGAEPRSNVGDRVEDIYDEARAWLDGDFALNYRGVEALIADLVAAIDYWRDQALAMSEAHTRAIGVQSGLEESARWFVKRCESSRPPGDSSTEGAFERGEVKSVVSYKRFRAHLEAIDKLRAVTSREAP